MKAQTLVLNAFQTASDMSMVQTGDATAVQSTGQPSGLAVTFDAAEWPYVNLVPPTAWNWSAYQGVAVDVTNTGAETLNFGLRADDSTDANGVIDCIAGVGSIPPGRSATFVLSLIPPPNASPYGMKALPPMFYGARMLSPVGGSVDLTHIVALRFYTWSLATPQTAVINNVRLIDALPVSALTTGIVDQYGQYTGATWPGKVQSDADFATEESQEAAALAASPVVAGRDQYGAWANGPTLTATGYFHPVQYNGRYWLVAPNGRLFYSVGMDTVSAGDATTVTGRNSMFTSLANPSITGGVTAQATDNDVMEEDFYAANVDAKYGASSYAQWQSTTLKRLRSWGFNTIGAWSDPSLFSSHVVPYTVALSIWGTYDTVPAIDGGSAMPDVYATNWVSAVNTSIMYGTEGVTGDPWCLGYFVDNELNWPNASLGDYDSLARSVLALSAAASPSKAEFVKNLATKYGTIGKLNAAWGTSFTSWAALQNPYYISAATTAGQDTDLVNFVTAYASTYYSTVKTYLTKYDSHHLYLGSRFATFTPAVLQAAASYVDVLSFNVYTDSLNAPNWSAIAQYNKPAMISEFDFGAIDHGMFSSGLVPAFDQAQRASFYQTYAQSVLALPNFVGYQWFQYVDEPNTGRSLDGENYNIGFVDVTDTPYTDLVSAAQQFNASVYTSRS